jgi:predicted transcriptional regulator
MAQERELWAKLLSSDIKVEILQLFHVNPKLTYSVEDVAKEVGRATHEVESELNDLLEVGVIKKKNDDPTLLCFDEKKDREIQARISGYLLKDNNGGRIRDG